jgi:hypothetical protein
MQTGPVRPTLPHANNPGPQLTGFLDPSAALATAAEGLEFAESRPLGGSWAPDGVQHRTQQVIDAAQATTGSLLASPARCALAPSGR